MTEDFSGFGLPAKMMQALTRMQFKAPTPIQAQALPPALEGKDILGSAQTGTGKTAAFGIPLVRQLMENPNMKALVMTPTRELATQVMETLQQIIPVGDMNTALLIGGDPMHRQLRQLQKNARVIIGTPGRINDHLERGTLKLETARVLVLDETDRMLDMGFGIQIEKIIKRMPRDRQTMMFSATLPKEIITLAGKYLNEPVRIAVGEVHKAAVKIKQDMVEIAEGGKYQELTAQLEKREGSIIIFVKTKYGADRLADRLCRDKHSAEAIHGNLQQRKREKVIQAFRDQKYRILVATDVAARGLDIPHVLHVINFDLPQVPEDYIHRIGRTARAGAEGAALSLVTPAEGHKWRAIQRLLNPGEKFEGRGERGGGGKGFRGREQGGGKKYGKGKPRRWEVRGEERPKKRERAAEEETYFVPQERPARAARNDNKPDAAERNPEAVDRSAKKEWKEKRAERFGGKKREWTPRDRDERGGRDGDDRPARSGGERPTKQDWKARDGDAPRADRRAERGDRKDWKDKKEWKPREGFGKPKFGQDKFERPKRDWKAKDGDARPARSGDDRPARSGGDRPKRDWKARDGEGRPAKREWTPRDRDERGGRDGGARPPKRDWKARDGEARPARSGDSRPKRDWKAKGERSGERFSAPRGRSFGPKRAGAKARSA